MIRFPNINELKKINTQIFNENKASLERIEKGSRNNSCFQYACRKATEVEGFNELLSDLIVFSSNNCEPSLDKTELNSIAMSAWSYREKVNEKELSVFSLNEFMSNSSLIKPVPIVEGLINRSELHIFSATAKTGKTLLQLHLAVAAARGELFLEHFSTFKGIKSLIIQTEISDYQLKERLLKICGNDFDDIKESIYLVNERIRIDKEEGLRSLESAIDLYKPDLVILDPFYTLHSKNEDSSSDIAPILSDIKEIVNKFNVALVLIHHQGKSSGSGQTGHKHRGSSAFADVPDGSWSLSKLKEKGEASLSFEMRNIESPGPFNCYLDEETLRWKVLGGCKKSLGDISVNDVVNYVLDNQGLSSGELAHLLSQKCNAGERTVKKRMASAIEKKKLVVVKDGARSKYYTSMQHAGA